MTDLDFEELDRAVNSALVSNNVKKQSLDKKEIIDVNTKRTTNETLSTKIDLKLDAQKSRGTEKLKLSPRQTNRSIGRFMDVVHPSSDMKANVIKSDIKDVESKKIANKQLKSETLNPHSMPDPLDAHEKVENIKNDTTQARTDSPFLPETKVEKRPLGAFSSYQTEIPKDDNSKPEEKTSDNENNSKNSTDIADEHKKDDLIEDDNPYEPNPETRNINLPPELQKDILDVESDPTTDKLGSSNPNKSKDPVPLGNPYLQSAQTEISQQYKEKNSQEKTSGSIYDTKEYHSPLSHPAKKKNGWNVIIWILLIVAVAIGIAYFVSSYLFAK